jgi:hypothetical protein
VDPGFDVCWNCGTTREGVEDPSFVRADDATPIQDPLYDPIAEPGPGVGEELSTDTAASPADGLVECYQALTLMEAKFLADQLTAQGIPALSDTQDFQDSLGAWGGNPRVYCRADDLPRARAWLAQYEERRRADPKAHLEP